MNSHFTDPALVEAFLDPILSLPVSTTEKVYRVLTARGFLLDWSPDGLQVSDNSHRDDPAVLNTLLIEAGVGSVEQGMVHLCEEPPVEALKGAFRVLGGAEAWFFDHWGRWANFRNRLHGPRVPVLMLDPFIARLLKSVNAIGVGTCSCCDGHGERPAELVFSGSYHATWFEVLLDSFVRPQVEVRCTWSRKANHVPLTTREVYCRIRPPNADPLVLYEELQAVAGLLYTNREMLREVKRSAVVVMEPRIRDLETVGEFRELVKRSAAPSF